MTNNNEYDYAGYEKSLKEILDHTQKDYWSQYVDINRHQVFVARTYLWVSVALIGTYAAIYKEGIGSTLTLSTSGILLLFLAFFLGIISFGICLYALPARSGYYRVANPSWGIYSQNAYNKLSKKENNVYTNTLTTLINNYDTGVVYNIKTNEKRAKLLRVTSWILIASFCISMLSGVSFIIENTVNKSTKDIVMSEENTNQSSDSSASDQTTNNVPDVPVPQGPIGGDKPNHQTHSIDREVDSITLTEGVEKK